MEDNKINEEVFLKLEDIKESKKKKRKLKKSVVVFLIACFVVFILAFIYFKFDDFNVKSIKVTGNTYLADDYIVDLSEIKETDKCLFLFADFKKAKMKKDPLINDVNIRLGKNNSVIIEVTENKVLGYQVAEKTNLILSDGSVIEFKAEYIKNLALLPLFTDINSDNLPSICESMSEIDKEILMRISEVTNLSFTYDTNMVKLVMDDGHFVYSSIKGLRYMNSYLELLVNQKNSKNKCFLILDEYHSAVNTDCSELSGYMNNQTQTNE